MNRRDFVKYAASVGIVAPVAGDVMAGITCGPVVPPGIQACRAGINSNVALIISRIQEQNQWCWAACIEMIFAYNNLSLSQSQIVNATWGSVVNMPATDRQIMMDLNRTWRDKNGIVFATSASPVSASAAAYELKNNMPLIICTLGHAMVLTALEYVTNPYTTAGEVKNAIVRDPWQNNGRRSLTPKEWYGTNLLLGVRCIRV
jgi:hypothetical protein